MPTRAIIKPIEPSLKTVGDDRELVAIATAVRACQVKAVESVIEMGRLLKMHSAGFPTTIKAFSGSGSTPNAIYPRLPQDGR